MAIRYEQPASITLPGRAYSPLSRMDVGELIFLSGQASLDVNGEVVGIGDFEEQLRQTYDNIWKVLETVGAGPRNILKITTYLVRSGDFGSFNEIRASFFRELYGVGPYPPATTVIVNSLVHPDLLVEIDVLAGLSE